MWSCESIDYFLQRLLELPSRKAVIDVLTKDSPVLRDRTEGPVGPELDYSILTARIPQRDWVRSSGEGIRGGYRPVLTSSITGFARNLRRASNDVLALHGHVETITLSEEGVRAWTEHAMHMGIRFNGPYGYILPGKRTREKYAKADFRAAKAAGRVPAGKRSPEAAVRRAAHRRASRRLTSMLRKVSLSEPVCLEPFSVRPSRTAKSLRKSWMAKSSGLRFSEYRLTQVVEPVITLSVCDSYRGPIPKVVVDAVNKIYSNYVRVPVVKKPPFPTVIAKTVDVPRPFGRFGTYERYLSAERNVRISRTLDLMREIEESGFPDNRRLEWYRLNHLYGELSKTVADASQSLRG